jgi:hypothetical protein
MEVSSGALVPLNSLRSFEGSDSIFAAPILFTYLQEAVYSDLSPKVLTEDGGTILITGSGFSITPYMKCRFRTPVQMVTTELTFTSESALKCPLPALDPTEVVQVDVTYNDGAEYDTIGVVSVQSRLETTTIAPTLVSMSGGSTVTITTVEGLDDKLSSLDYSNIYCTYEAIATRHMYKQATYDAVAKTYTCVTPPFLSTGDVNVVLAEYSKESETYTSLLTSLVLNVHSDINVNTITPKNIMTNRETQVTLTGTGFVNTDTTKVKYTVPGSDEVVLDKLAITYVDSTTLYVMLPALADTITETDTRLVIMYVSMNGQDYELTNMDSISFNIITSLQVDSIVPAFVFDNDDVSLSLVGNNFLTELGTNVWCRANGVVISNGNIISNSYSMQFPSLCN